MYDVCMMFYVSLTRGERQKRGNDDVHIAAFKYFQSKSD